MTTPAISEPGGSDDNAVPLAAPPGRIRPGRIWYLLPLLVFLGGVALLVFGLLSLDSHIGSFPRVAIPAGGQVSLGHSGGYVVYYEGPGAQSGHLPAFRVRVIPAAAPAAATSLTPYATSVTYGFGSRQGRAVLTLQVSRPGRFLVETPGASGLPAGSDLAFGDSIAGGIAGVAVFSGLLMFAGLAGLVVILVIRIAKTRRARAAASSAAASGWSPPGSQP
jgi:hypothetical protein